MAGEIPDINSSFTDFINCIEDLKFDEKPNYRYLKSIFNDSYPKVGVSS